MTRQLVLLGTGLAHLHLLKHLARHPVPGAQVTLVSARAKIIHAPMVAGFMAGHHALEACTLELEALIQHSHVRWLKQTARAMDPQNRLVLLDDGSELPFDVLSVNGKFAQSRDAVEAAMPGARQNALLTWPLDAFCALWPRVTELADARPQRVAMIDNAGGTGAIQLAFAIRHRLPGSAVTLITGGRPVAHTVSSPVQTRIVNALQQRNITVLADSVVAIQAGEVTLGSGARLACDVPVVNNGAVAPVWAADSNLALDDIGAIAVDASLRSASHPHIFSLPPEGIGSLHHHALPRLLTHNLLTTLAGQMPKPLVARWNQLGLLSCGDGQGIAQWGQHSAQGRWVGWLKTWMDRKAIAL